MDGFASGASVGKTWLLSLPKGYWGNLVSPRPFASTSASDIPACLSSEPWIQSKSRTLDRLFDIQMESGS
jgi:hypothetical protein